MLQLQFILNEHSNKKRKQHGLLFDVVLLRDYGTKGSHELRMRVVGSLHSELRITR